MRRSKKNSALTGAAFLMATSAIGPGFLTQTTVFTGQLMASFGFVILLSVLLDLGAQLNIWRIIAIKEARAPVIANQVIPGLGYFLSVLVAVGGLAFNIGNIAGCGLGLQVLTGMDLYEGAFVSGGIALVLFWLKEAGKAMDLFTKILGIVMVALMTLVAFHAAPPLTEAACRSVWPKQISSIAIITLVGGTVGGYISFAGGHRLLDAGIQGAVAIPQVTRSAITGILVTALMRALLFLAVLGVLHHGGILDSANPPASVFKQAAGNIGYLFFGMVMWCAAITSVVGAAYTSVSFLKNIHPVIGQRERWVISGFILLSTLIFRTAGNPVNLLITVGAFNGLILPLSLAIMLLAVQQKKQSGPNKYRHPWWLGISGWLVVACMGWMSILTLCHWALG